MKSEECIELKNIKYKSMLLNNNSDEIVETVENMSNLDQFLEGEKKTNRGEPWAKLDKTSKMLRFNEFAINYCNEPIYSNDDKQSLITVLSNSLDRKKLLKAKEVLYDKDEGKIISIPSLVYNNTMKRFTLKRSDKRPSTLKCLAPKKSKGNDKKKTSNDLHP
tara:strand:- start:1918 stop:2406 length:489 start_codon:yes stop_codon:yes gene_type:complete